MIIYCFIIGISHREIKISCLQFVITKTQTADLGVVSWLLRGLSSVLPRNRNAEQFFLLSMTFHFLNCIHQHDLLVYPGVNNNIFWRFSN